MEENIQLWFEPEPDPVPGANRSPKDFEHAQKVNKGHGRIEMRQITVSSQLKDFFDWPYLEQVFMLKRRITSIKTGTVKETIVYGFTSLSRIDASADKLLSLILSYWGIENGLHYRRDVSLREDYTHITKGNAGQVLACINNLVIGILIGKQKFKYLPSARRYFNADPARAFAVITGL